MNAQDQPIYFNGLDPRTGEYMFAPQTPRDIAKTVARDAGYVIEDEEALDHAAELNQRVVAKSSPHLGTLAVDPNDLAQAGWCVVFPWVDEEGEDGARQQAIFDALRPLLDLRQQQAGRFFKVIRGTDGYRTQQRESKPKFLARFRAGPGPSDPERVPYYLLLVGSPLEIPFAIQYQLDVQYAVGRIHFDTIDEYAAYANSVVAAERGGLQLAREVASFAVANEDDPATQLSWAHLITPLFDTLQRRAPTWSFRRYDPAQSTKSTLAGLLSGGEATPAVLFTASHGAGFAKGDPLQRRHQGALVCQDWPGPVKWSRKPIPDSHYFSADDLASTANPHGAIVFNFACYGAGTPEFNDYGQRAGAEERVPIADAPFLSALHQRMLSLPRGGVLAAIGHVERAWGCSFLWPGTGGRTGSASQIGVFESALFDLLRGWRIGAALETFNQRYAELSSDLTVVLEDISFKKKVDALTVADMWTANNDARGYAITGDPAVRIPVAPPGGEVRRVEVQRIELRTAAVAATPEPAPPEPAPRLESAAKPTSGAPTNPYANFSADGGLTLDVAELTRVLGGDRSLTVRTIVGDPETSDPDAAPQLVSRVDFGGSITTHRPADVDPALQQLHADLLTHALAYRTALLTALARSRR